MTNDEDRNKQRRKRNHYAKLLREGVYRQRRVDNKLRYIKTKLREKDIEDDFHSD